MSSGRDPGDARFATSDTTQTNALAVMLPLGVTGEEIDIKPSSINGPISPWRHICRSDVQWPGMLARRSAVPPI